MHMMQCHWTKQRLKTLLLFLCIRTKEGPTREKNIPRKCNLQQKEERISSNEKVPYLNLNPFASSRTKNGPPLIYVSPENQKKSSKRKKKTISSSLRCTGKMKWGKIFEAVLNMEAASRLGKRRRVRKKKLISFPFSLHNFSTVRLRNWHYVKSFLLFHFPSGPIINFFCPTLPEEN